MTSIFIEEYNNKIAITPTTRIIIFQMLMVEICKIELSFIKSNLSKNLKFKLDLLGLILVFESLI